MNIDLAWMRLHDAHHMSVASRIVAEVGMVSKPGGVRDGEAPDGIFASSSYFVIVGQRGYAARSLVLALLACLRRTLTNCDVVSGPFVDKFWE